MQLEKIEKASICLKALSNPIRLAILCGLRDGEKSVQALEEMIGASQSNISSNLGIMKDRGILTSRRDAHQVFYRVKDERMFELLDLLQEIYCPE